MSIDTGFIIGIGIAVVLIYIAHRWDKRRHRDRLEHIQERIRRRESRTEQDPNRS